MKLPNVFNKIGAALLAALSSPQVQNWLIKLLKTKLVKAITVNLLNVTGVQAWLVNLVIEEGVEFVDERAVEPIFRAFGYQGDDLKGVHVYRRVKNAEDVAAWFRAIRDV